MALNKALLKADILKIFNDQSAEANNDNYEKDPAKVADKIAGAMADAIEKYVKGGDIYLNSSNIIAVAPPTGGTCVVSPATAKLT